MCPFGELLIGHGQKRACNCACLVASLARTNIEYDEGPPFATIYLSK